MTSDQLRNILSRIPVMESPFANGASTLRNILYETSDAGLRWDSGFPDNPYAKKLSDGGKHVLLGDMNGMSNAASVGLYMRQNGGTNEFSETVLLVDKGFKGNDGHWGYPRGAIIDWWKGQNDQSGTFRKVMCVKNGESTDEGNCTLGPDDPIHGVEGSGEKWWIDITYEPRSYTVVPAEIGENWTYDSETNRYTVTDSCIVQFEILVDLVNNFGHSQGNISTSDTIYIIIPMTKGDVFYFTTNNGLTIFIKPDDASDFGQFTINPYIFETWGTTEVRFRGAGIYGVSKYVMT